MDKLSEAKKFLEKIGMPAKQQSDICCYSLLALAGIKPCDNWKKASQNWIRIHDVIDFTKKHYKKTYAENTRETIRKTCMHSFREAAIIEDSGTATNSPKYQYRLTDEALSLIQEYRSSLFEESLNLFLKKHKSLIEKYSNKRKMALLPVSVNGKNFNFSLGKHNQLQKEIIENFAPRFAPGCSCLYIGDTEKKDLFKDEQAMENLGFYITLHDKMPDIVLYRKDKKWIYFIEAVTSVGAMTAQRLLEINKMTEKVNNGKIFITAFPDRTTFKKFISELAWETEVWIAEEPDHLIHLNGDKFLGPRQ